MLFSFCCTMSCFCLVVCSRASLFKGWSVQGLVCSRAGLFKGFKQLSIASTIRSISPALFALSLAVAGFAGTHFLLAHASGRQAEVDIIPAKVDLGHLGQYAVVDRVVQLSNTTSLPLKISSVTPSCGCTTTDAPDFIPPHGQAPLKIHFNALSRTGAVQEEVDVSLSGRQPAHVAIPIVGTVTPEIALSQAVLHLPGNQKAASLTLTRLDGKPLNVSNVHAPAFLEAEALPVSDHTIRLVASQSGSCLSGVHDETIALHLNDPLVPELVVPVSWTTKSAYQCAPLALNFGSVPSGSVLKRKIRITEPNAAHLRLVSLPPGWKTQLQPVAPEIIDLTLNGSSKGGLLHSSVVLGTGNVHEPHIAIPIYAVFETSADVCSVKPSAPDSH